MARPRSLSPDQIQHARSRYEAGDACTRIATSLKVSRKTVERALRSEGVTLTPWQREPTKRREGHRRYTCDHHFFDSIDSERKAYWLGFIAADGCNTNGFLSVGLSSVDKDHLFLLRDALASTHPVYDRVSRRNGPSFGKPDTSVSALAIRSLELTSGLSTNGIVPRKTFTLQWPSHLPESLLPHYLRGYSDGDGYFSVSRSSYRRKRDGQRGHTLHWGIVGNEQFCRGAQDFLVSRAGVKATELYPSPNAVNEGIFQLRYGGNQQVSRIYQLMYDDATVWMPRKRDKASSFLHSPK